MLEPPGGRPWLLYALLSASLTLNLALVIKWPDSSSPTRQPCSQVADPKASPATEPPREPQAQEQWEQDASSPLAAPRDSYVVSHVIVEHSLARTFQSMMGRSGDVLSAHYSRIFCWDLDLRRDVQKNDEITLAWREDAGGDLDIPVAWYRSGKLGKTLKAYRFQPPGDLHPSYWFPDGLEVPFRLVDGPIEDYIQITARLEDRLDHKGYDFKAPVGTDVKSPRAGKVSRVDWNVAVNGSCVEIKQNDGVTTKYLHLSEALVRPGQNVQAGQLIARTGNTGRSTAPHLHYQLERNGKIIDPSDYHETTRRRLPTQAMPGFRDVVAFLDSWLKRETSTTP